jgi:methenyltetrahydrofolate cyclohydrolase
MLADQTVRGLLDAFSASTPTPGGGSASALSGALGASLFAMVAGFQKTRHSTPEDRTALDGARTRLLDLRHQLIDLIDRDAAAYDLVVAAYKRPKGTEDEKAARKAAILDATRIATEVPLETMQACAGALDAGRTVADLGNPSAASDIAVATQTLANGFNGALLNVATNLEGLSDQPFVDRVSTDAHAAANLMSESIRHIYQAGGVIVLMQQAAARAGIRHGQPPGPNVT